MEIVKHIVDAAQGKHPLGSARSGQWPAVRRKHLAEKIAERPMEEAQCSSSS